MLTNSHFLLPDTNQLSFIMDPLEQKVIFLTALGGLLERVDKTASILTNSGLVCGFEFDHSSTDWLLA